MKSGTHGALQDRLKLVYNNSNHLDTHPKRVQFMLAASAEVIILIPPAKVVEAHPQSLFISGHGNLERLTGLGAFLEGFALGFHEQGKGMRRIRRKCQLPWLQISQRRTETGRSADVLSGLI